ncbi:MAG: deoxyribodipyrimidine photo-lyase [Actinomycetota bacterium]
MSTPIVFWFRRDLRRRDHPALQLAAESGPVVPVFVHDPILWDRSGANRQAFLAEALASLDAGTDHHLVVRRGVPERELVELCREVGAERVIATADFGPYGTERDERVAEALATLDGRLELVDSPYAVPPGSVTKGDGGPYKVFTPFFRAWKKIGWGAPDGPVDVEWATVDDRGRLPTAPTTSAELPTATEAAAWERVERFLADGVDTYHQRRDDPGVDGTSRLSPYLKWGLLHPRQLLARLDETPGHETFRSELAWREFYADVLHQWPASARQAFRPEMGDMELDDGPEADERFAAWADGRTGYPIVDAGMRQLVGEGWMHNRVRMIVASFLVKDLHLDWTRGARFFMEHLVDGDLASNNHGWQWVAGTGTDAAPYFRVFNPVTQSQKFDPTGRYIRRWVPELASLSDKTVHAPWTEPAGAPAAYPAPVVDHGAEREEALRRYDRLKARRA